MNRLLALAFCVPLVFGGLASAQEKKPAPAPAAQSAMKDGTKADQPKVEDAKKAAPPEADLDAGMMEDAPGEMHKWLEHQTGEWTASSTPIGPDGKPMPAEKGKMKSKMAIGGRFVHSEFHGMMMGQPFHGEGYLGYSNVNQRFEMCWVDSNMTSMLFLTGQLDAAKKTLTLSGDMPIPGMKAQFKIVSTILSKDAMKDEMYMVVEGKDQKMMEVNYTRAAASGESKGEGKSEGKGEKKEGQGDAKKPDKK
jgi:hypothetical protein